MIVAAHAAGEIDIEPGLAGKVPVRSKFALLLFAAGLARFLDELSGALDDVPPEAASDFQALLAQLLLFAVRHRLRRNLSIGYLPQGAVLKRVRGRIDLLRTVSGALLEKGEVACQFEELTADTPRNRLVRAALVKIGTRLVDDDLSHACRSLARDLGEFGVGSVMPSRSELTRDVIGRNDAHDLLMVSIARLLLEPSLPWERGGDRRTALPSGDLVFWRVYELAIARIIELTHPTAAVRAQTYQKWPLEDPSPGATTFWPRLSPDIVINHSERFQLIVDTKFTSIVAEHHDTMQFKSAHLYQMLTYLLTTNRRNEASSPQGLLLYPGVGEGDRDEWASVRGNRIRLATVDLSMRPDEIVSRVQQLSSWRSALGTQSG